MHKQRQVAGSNMWSHNICTVAQRKQNISIIISFRFFIHEKCAFH